uniref:Serine/threonine-protein kinase n=1 Tax=Kalanchoe fedtschenkoi TaxID=63787 RepID=A0A7N0UWF5_KALFE
MKPPTQLLKQVKKGGEEEKMSVAVAVCSGPDGGRGSHRAVKWAVENLNLLPEPHKFILLHVMPPVTSIPTPSGNSIPIHELDPHVVKMYLQDRRVKLGEVFTPFKKYFRNIKVETMLLEGVNPAFVLVRHVSESRIKSLVLGSYSSTLFTRKSKGLNVPSIVLRYAPDTCDIYVISREKVITNLNNLLSVGDFTDSPKRNGGQTVELFEDEQICQISASEDSSGVLLDKEINHICGPSNQEAHATNKRSSSFSSLSSKNTNPQTEVEHLQSELRNSILMYKQACEQLAHAQNKVKELSSECLNDSRQVSVALQREELLKKIAAMEKAKHLEAIKEAELARDVLAKETYERQLAEMHALKESLEKQKIVNTLFVTDKRYRRYTQHEIEVATDFFSETRVIGEGGYGKVYKGTLDHTPVAIKVLRPDASDKKEEFLKEVEVLSRIRHPHLVSLLGASSESVCLVYEFMENGSLDEHIFCQNGKPALPWVVRFRIIYEIACGLTFLHNSKPESIVHRDLKPGNVLLDRNYMSKIGDVGLAKFISNVVPDDVTEYRDSVLAGTLHYMDPEYHRTGTLRPKSDLYAFGIIIIQLLTARHPKGILFAAEKAIRNGSWVNMLDKSVSNWPLLGTEELAQLALKCSQLRCRDRPDLDEEILPVLKRLCYLGRGPAVSLLDNHLSPPNHYFCPILQEVMNDPYIAADGFTYEHIAIKAWLEKHTVSPLTKLELKHKLLTPNYTLRSSIQEWKTKLQSASSNA